MQLYYYRGSQPNFGDELSSWLMPRVFPDLLDDDPETIFLGIGSILYDFFPKTAHKIVFGSGYGGYTRPPEIDDNWRIYGVRGPLTAKALNLPPAAVAGDAAILVNRHRPRSAGDGGAVSFMPHYDSLARGHWQRTCALAGIDYIDPRGSVTDIMDRIQASRLVISEAMHGIIVADALRVPWVAVEPIDAVHHMKWRDWSGALDLAVQFSPLAPSSMREMMKRRQSRRERARAAQAGPSASQSRSAGYLEDAWKIVEIGLSVTDPIFVQRAACALQRAAQSEPNLSSDRALDRALDRLQTNADRILAEYGPALREQRLASSAGQRAID
jgi:succinoglycan biosynthesis protein ExoV